MGTTFTEATLKGQNIKEIDDSALTLTRRKSGRGHAYYTGDGTKISDRKVLKRVKSLVIPPMWTDVHICKFEDGHIQATGRDLKGRKQYIYHVRYEKYRQAEKFKKLFNFVTKLPKFRKRAKEDLSRSGWPKVKLLALITMLLDEYGIRIGNKVYKDRNATYGLTTLRRKHLNVDSNNVVFSFKGKSGQTREVFIDDAELVPFIKQAAELPGYEIFRFRDEGRKFRAIDSEDVNGYIMKVIGKDYSSKYFRTWTANRLAMDYYPLALEIKEAGSKKKFGTILFNMVANALGNTPKICKEYYVHPAILAKVNSEKVPFPNPFQDHGGMGLSASEQLAKHLIAQSY
mgnify:CR=1 FL=1